ncbi:MAG: NADH-quinone oxidoreductase subunit K [Microbacterium arborescens]
MSATLLFLGAGAAVFVLGVVAHLVVRDLIRRIVALNVASGGVMLVLLALADRGSAETGAPDPVPQALVLTGIVVMAAITGLALLLARRVERGDDENESGSAS